MEQENNNYDYDILTLVDDEGEEHQFELVDTVEVDGQEYAALIPVYDDPDQYLNDDGELVIMKLSTEDGEDFLDAVEDDDEYAKVSGIITEKLSDMFDFDEDEE